MGNTTTVTTTTRNDGSTITVVKYNDGSTKTTTRFINGVTHVTTSDGKGNIIGVTKNIDGVIC